MITRRTSCASWYATTWTWERSWIATRSRYRLRKQTVEPVFGQIKEARGLRGFLLRGLHRVEAEWSIVCTAHNLLKLMRASPAPT